MQPGRVQCGRVHYSRVVVKVKVVYLTNNQGAVKVKINYIPTQVAGHTIAKGKSSQTKLSFFNFSTCMRIFGFLKAGGIL